MEQPLLMNCPCGDQVDLSLYYPWTSHQSLSTLHSYNSYLAQILHYNSLFNLQHCYHLSRSIVFHQWVHSYLISQLLLFYLYFANHSFNLLLAFSFIGHIHFPLFSHVLSVTTVFSPPSSLVFYVTNHFMSRSDFC